MRMRSEGTNAIALPSKTDERFAIGLQVGDFDNALTLMLAEYGAGRAHSGVLQRAFVQIEGAATLRQVADKLLQFAGMVEQLAAEAERRERAARAAP